MMMNTLTQAKSGTDSFLLDELMLAVLDSAVDLERRRLLVGRVDGQVIGTGQSDFTTANTAYTLSYEGKMFELVDVPGIEGDESRFEPIVQEAIAKAHLVFYVNGTNKKPEKATADKIRSYLNRGTQVCPIVNVRGSADAYEFDEDRIDLELHGRISAALSQTVTVLESVLGANVLLSGHCAQGLLAFSSLAFNDATSRTTIHHSRDRDLVVQQRNYLKHFGCTDSMFEFSQVGSIADVLRSKVGTFKEDIIEANKIKVVELLSENVLVLKSVLNEHEAFITRVEPEFRKCHEALMSSLSRFSRLNREGRKNVWNKFFNELQDDADDIVMSHFGENELILERIQGAFKQRKKDVESELEAQFNKNIGDLQSSVRDAVTRLMKDVSRVRFEEQALPAEVGELAYESIELDKGIEFRELGGFALKVGSYAASGGAIGSLIAPGLGTAIGAITGGLIGIFSGVFGFLRGKAARIRHAQGKVRDSINEQRDQFLKGLNEQADNLAGPANETVAETRVYVNKLFTNLKHPTEIIGQQISLMTDLNTKLEKMPRGKIQAIY